MNDKGNIPICRQLDCKLMCCIVHIYMGVICVAEKIAATKTDDDWKCSYCLLTCLCFITGRFSLPFMEISFYH